MVVLPNSSDGLVKIDILALEKQFNLSISGSFLRSALIFSSVLGRSFDLDNIFTGRSPPGLSSSHVKTISLFQKATGALVEGNFEGSTRLLFSPQRAFSLKKEFVDLDDSSLSLALVPLMIVGIFSEDKMSLSLLGGTNHGGAPSLTFVRETLVRYFNKYVSEIRLNVKKSSFFDGDESGSVLGDDFLFDDLSSGDLELPSSLGEDSPLDVSESVNAEFLLRPKYVLENAPRLDLSGSEFVAVKGDFFASADFVDSDCLDRFSRFLDLSFRSEKNGGLAVRASRRYVSTKRPVIHLHLFAYGGDGFGFDNDKPLIFAKDLRLEVDSCDLVDEKVLAFISSFRSGLSDLQIDYSSAELLFPFLALVGGSFKTDSLTDILRSLVVLAGDFFGLEVSFYTDRSSNVFSFLGYEESLRKGAVDLDDL